MTFLRSTGRVLALFCALQAAAPASARAQEPVSITADFLFYGDNTEFANEFRRGETLLGNSGQLVIGADIGDRGRLTGGVFGDRRFGSWEAFNIVRPIFTLDVRAGASRFTFGTLSLAPQPAFGPDRGGPHGLLPAIQRETLSLTRPYEAGLQWTYRLPRVEHDVWISWQRLNTPAGREILDAGVVGHAALRKNVAVAYQWHIVHHGGQTYHEGPVSDSWVAAPGLVLTSAGATRKATVEAYGLLSRHVPNREQMSTATTGVALFTRAAVEDGGWRAHLIVWRGNDYIKEEGDPNYGGLLRNGARFRKVRDYAELGLTRISRPLPPLSLEASARLHRVESHYEYSYRILGRVTLRWPVR